MLIAANTVSRIRKHTCGMVYLLIFGLAWTWIFQDGLPYQQEWSELAVVGHIEGDNIVSKAFRRTVLQSTQPPVIHIQKTGDGATEAAKGDTVLTELHYQWSNRGGCWDILGELLVRDRRTEAHHKILSFLSTDRWWGCFLDRFVTACLWLWLTVQRS